MCVSGILNTCCELDCGSVWGRGTVREVSDVRGSRCQGLSACVRNFQDVWYCRLASFLTDLWFWLKNVAHQVDTTFHCTFTLLMWLEVAASPPAAPVPVCTITFVFIWCHWSLYNIILKFSYLRMVCICDFFWCSMFLLRNSCERCHWVAHEWLLSITILIIMNSLQSSPICNCAAGSPHNSSHKIPPKSFGMPFVFTLCLWQCFIQHLWIVYAFSH